MKKNNEFIEIAKGLTNIAQFGLSIITPIILCALLGAFLKNHYQIPDFVVILIILFGIVSGISSAATFIKAYLKRIEKEDKDNKNK